MQIKNKFLLLIVYIFGLTIFSINTYAEELDISAIEIIIDKEKNTVVGKGAVKVIGYGGKIIKADKVTYEKSKEFLLAEGSVEIFDAEGNVLKTKKAMYNRKNEIISSDQDSIFNDSEGNIVTVTMFQYNLKENLFSSVGKIKVKDINNNKYFFKEIYVDTKKKEMVGSDVSAVLDQENFGLTKESDPRFVSNDIFMSKDKSDFSKGIFTVCKERKDKCPPWSLQAKKISHNKIKKIIYYENAVLKVYGVPIFFFPRFYHPDPTVKRTSGFLAPVFTNTSTTGFGFGLPYYWKVSHDKDLTFTPKTYNNENILYLNEYRQAFRNGFLTLDTSYHKGYKETSSTKTPGSRNHIFAQLDFDLSKLDLYESSFQFKTQRTSNDTYFKVHDINTSLVNSENTTLENEIKYNFSKDNMFLDLSVAAYENLSEKTNNRYEFVTPNILYGKTFFTERFGSLDFKSNAFYKNYDADKHTIFFNNDIIWSPGNKVTRNGFVNTLQGILKNTNYKARNTGGEYKTNGTVNELNSVLSYKSSLPMEKKGIYSSKLFSPTFMIKYAPGHMRNLSKDDVGLNYMNLYSVNKTSEIENGLSAILGFDFKTIKKDKKGDDVDKLSISMGQVFNKEENNDLPSKSSLDQKTSDLVGAINYNFSDIGKIQYKFALDHNFNDLNYNEISTNLNFGKIGFNVDYLEEQNHVGNENFITTGVSFNFNEQNTLNLQTKKNFKTESTEFYDISYQYAIDCLTAGLLYRREFYDDGDLDAEPKDSLMFTIKFIPFTGVKTPSVISP
jgi:LPS-assembly protein